MSAIRKEELVAKDIQYKIDQGLISSGQKLSERSIAKEYAISRGTARTALQRLEKEGLIKSKQAVGYFINQPKKEPLLNFINYFSDKFAALSIPNEAQTINILSTKLIDTDKELSEKLKVVLGTIFLLVSLQILETDSNNYTLCRVFIPAKKSSTVNEEQIMALIKRQLQLAIDAEVTMNLSFADDNTASFLHVPNHNPLLTTSTIFKDKNNQTCLFLEQSSDANHAVSIMPSEIISRKLGTFNE